VVLNFHTKENTTRQHELKPTEGNTWSSSIYVCTHIFNWNISRTCAFTYQKF